MKKNVNRNKLLNIASVMPPLRHSMPNEKFDIKKSEVVSWLIGHTEILNYVWNNIKNSDAIKYNPDTGEWQGVNYEPDED